MSTEKEDILFHLDAKEKLLQGAIHAIKPFQATFGPYSPDFHEILSFLPQEEKDQATYTGIQLIKSYISKIQQDLAESKKTSLILLQALLEKALPYLKQGISAPILIKQLEEALSLVLNYLEKTKDTYFSSSHPETFLHHFCGEIPSIILQAWEKTGDSQAIFIDSLHQEKESFHLEEGFAFSSEALFPPLEKEPTEVFSPTLIVTEKEMISSHDIFSLLQMNLPNQKPIFLIAKKISQQALATLSANKKKRIYVVIPSTTIPWEKPLFQKTEAQQIPLSPHFPIYLGSLKKALLFNQKSLLLFKESSFPNLALIYSGGKNKEEKEQKKREYEKSLHLLQIAKEGIFPGGGTSLFRCAYEVQKDFPSDHAGAQMLFYALQKPLKQLLLNAKAKEDPSFALFHPDYGFEVTTKTWLNLKQEGVIELAYYLKKALIYAKDQAKELLLTEVLLFPFE